MDRLLKSMTIVLASVCCCCSAETPPQGAGAGAAPQVISQPGALPTEGDTPSWPRFNGPDGMNVSPDKGLLAEWPKGGPPLAWEASGIGMGFAGVTLAEGMVFTSGNIEDKTVVTALNLEGQLVWQAENGPAWTDPYGGTRGTPTYDDGRVYHESPVGQVTCYEARTGSPVWSVNILEQFGAENIQWGLAESVLVDGSRLICCPGGEQASIVALDKATGKTVWKASGTGVKTGYASPVIAEQEGLRIVLTMNAKALIGVNADTGELLFEHPHETDYDVNATMPVFRDGRIFITSGYRSGSEMLALAVSGTKASVKSVWKSKELDNQHGGVVVLGGHIYGAAHSSNGGRWICLDWETGEMKYAERGVGKGSLTAADGMLYTLSEKRDVGLVKATPKAHEVISQFEMPSGGEGPSWAHPVVIGGRLYLRHADKLFAYDIRPTR
ncbi:MAG: PQQ-binding-like beta-propeller repeat protein [Thermoguttaceae bacterium]|nr:PQQ-binding-like beta-propeller repeat protein [Thermoguttaceae bacterium]